MKDCDIRDIGEVMWWEWRDNLDLGDFKLWNMVNVPYPALAYLARQADLHRIYVANKEEQDEATD